MTPQEYRALREACGLSQEDAREFHGIKNASSVAKWENGKSYISEMAEEKIKALNELIQKSVDNALIEFNNQTIQQGSPPDVVVLVTYSDADFETFMPDMVAQGLPNGAHKAIVRRTYLALIAMEAKVAIVEMNKDDFLDFISANKMPDNKGTRSAWAVDYYTRFRNEAQ